MQRSGKMQLTDREACILTAYTGKLFCKTYGEFHEFAEDLMQQQLWTHVFADKKLAQDMKDAVEPEARKIFASIEYVD